MADDDGKAWLVAFGWGSYGRLGVGLNKVRNSPWPLRVLLPASNDFEHACGAGHEIALDRDTNTIRTWGKCHYGQLGHGSIDEDEHVPRVVEGFPDQVVFSSVGAGESNCFATTSEGCLWAWGIGFFGALGNGSEDHSTVPLEIALPDGVRFSFVTGGRFHTVALTPGGEVFVFGKGEDGQLGLDSVQNVHVPTALAVGAGVEIVHAACGESHTVLVARDGTAYTMGDNDGGQLGHGDTEARAVPTRIESMVGSGDNATTPMAAVTRCAAQAGQSGFVTSGGAVLMCGVQMWGRLGTPIWAPSTVPAPVVGLDGSDGAPTVVDLALGNSHSVAVTAEGAVWEWGSNECGKFGLGPHGFDTVVPHPVPLTTLDGLVATAVACGSNQTFIRVTGAEEVLVAQRAAQEERYPPPPVEEFVIDAKPAPPPPPLPT